MDIWIIIYYWYNRYMDGNILWIYGQQDIGIWTAGFYGDMSGYISIGNIELSFNHCRIRAVIGYIEDIYKALYSNRLDISTTNNKYYVNLIIDYYNYIVFNMLCYILLCFGWPYTRNHRGSL